MKKLYGTILIGWCLILNFVVWPMTWRHDAPILQQLFGGNTFPDLFWWWKSALWALLGLVSLPALIIWRKSLSPMAYAVAGSFFIGVALAAFQAPVPALLMSGVPDGSDNLLYWLSMPAVTLALFGVMSDAGLRRRAQWGVVAVTLLFATMGVTEWLHVGWMDATWLAHLWFGPDLSTVKVTRAGLGGFTLTLANPNYVGSLAALLGPFCCWMFVTARRLQPVLLAAAWGALVLLAGSASRGAWIGVSVAGVVTLLVCWRQVLWKRVVVLALPSLLFFTSLPWVTTVTGRAQTLSGEWPLFWKNAAREVAGDRVATVRGPVLDLQWLQKHVQFSVTGNTVTATTALGVPIPLTLVPPRGFKVEMAPWNEGRWEVVAGENGVDLSYFSGAAMASEWRFHYQGGRWARFIGDRWLPLQNATVWSIFGLHPRLFSMRVSIWERSLPLLADFGLLGAGAGQYAVLFPQGDLAYKMQFFKDYNSVIDKPHEGYLGIWFAAGLIGILTFLSVLGFAWKGMRRNVSAVAAIAAYSVVLLVNDHVVQTVGLFTVLLALALRPESIVGSDIVGSDIANPTSHPSPN